MDSVMAKKCQYCSAAVGTDDKTCRYCGERLVCSMCSADVKPGATFCSSCGTRYAPTPEPALAGFAAQHAPVAADPWLMQAPAAQSWQTTFVGVHPYATFWPRFAASLIDGLVLVIPAVVVGMFTAGIGGIAIGWLYFALMVSSSRQATLGMQALGIVCTDVEGQPLGFGRATGRFFASYLTALTLGIGYLMYFWTERKQTLHDKIAGTIVVTRG